MNMELEMIAVRCRMTSESKDSALNQPVVVSGNTYSIYFMLHTSAIEPLLNAIKSSGCRESSMHPHWLVTREYAVAAHSLSA